MKKDVSLVLSCGGARGLAHIGIIEALEEKGLKINAVSGSSIGAVIGGIYAAGKLQDYKEWISSLNAKDILKLMDFTIHPQGILKGEKVFKAMQEFLPDQNIEDLNIPFVAVGTDIRRKQEYIFNKGSLYDAMRASVAVPGIFTPSYIEGNEIVDGGVLSPIPLDFIEKKESSIVIVSNVNCETDTEQLTISDQKEKKAWLERILNPTGSPKENNDRLKLFNIYNDSISLMNHKITQMTLEKHRPDIVINISKNICGMFEFHFAKELITLGKKKCHQAFLPSGTDHHLLTNRN